MKQRITALIVLCCLLLSLCCGCDNGEDTSESSTPQISQTKDDSTPESKPTLTEGRTMFIYMCGSNLETKQGLAGKNINEILSADSADLNIVIQTGGAQTWRSHDISESAAQRYEVKNGELVLLDTLTQLNMGDAQTLTDFLAWGQENYPTDHNMLVLWDHGGGAAKGVCFDENYGFDGLTLSELHSALEEAKLNTKFDIIGFDACLMATVETAYTVQNFSEYMIASEEIEPSGGWDYKALVEAFAGKTDNMEISKAVCDSFLEKCKAAGKDTFASLTVFDLSKTDALIEKFNDFIGVLEKNISDKNFSSFITDSLNRTEKMGGDRTAKGGSNMIDMISFATRVALKIDDDVQYLWSAVYDLVPYSVQGQERFTCGMSFYYPERYDKDEIESYTDLSVCEAYNSYLSDYYLDVPATTIEYADRGSISENEAFTVSLTPKSGKYLSAINYQLITTDNEGKQHILCTDNDINADWDNLKFGSNFVGVRLALNGHPMYFSTVTSTDFMIRYSAPVKVNGKRTNLIFFSFLFDDPDYDGNKYEVFGTWDGYDENGLPSMEYNSLKEGDKIQVVKSTTMRMGVPIEIFSEEFTIGEDGGKITELPLDGKEYQYVFVATDIFGNTYCSDMATFRMTKSYDELLENPLPDETFAAEVTNIEPYSAE